MHKTMSFSSGYQTKSLPVETRELVGLSGSLTFVCVVKKTDWLKKMAGGDLKRAASIMDALKKQWKRAFTSGTEGVTDDAPPADDDEEESDDPMNQCDDIVDVTPDPKRHRASKDTPAKESFISSKKKTSKVRGQIKYVEARKYSPSAFPTNTTTIKIGVVVTNTVGKGKLWVQHSDILWLVEYLAGEVATGGVIASPGSAVAGAEIPNCTTQWLSVRVKPQQGQMHIYEAQFVGGPLNGKTLQSSVLKFNQDKWAKCMSTGHYWHCPGPLVKDASGEDIRRACAHYL
jgi:hypothetical protein